MHSFVPTGQQVAGAVAPTGTQPLGQQAAGVDAPIGTQPLGQQAAVCCSAWAAASAGCRCASMNEQPQQQQAVMHDHQCKDSNMCGVCPAACKLISRHRSGMGVCSRWLPRLRPYRITEWWCCPYKGHEYHLRRGYPANNHHRFLHYILTIHSLQITLCGTERKLRTAF
ncbi:hypothetical protein HaLaN_07867 [Haematococcus lacustris]|uniref:Uncharacterized protein n=1 Tax=Haematococcus lacustris TaxID=44745 RepID=A0A699YYY0_HAELA|nr:hypothetical protein HaLaN_07867 [Haematococcus lacustris]